MRIKSSDLPQADRIESVLMTVIAVGNGARADIDIANEIPGIEGDDRQGRYYRNAAELLGFIQNTRNNSVLTNSGRKLLKNPILTNPHFINSVLGLKVYQKLLPYLEINSNGCTRQKLIDYLVHISDPNMGSTMIPRRISTILAWPRSLGFVEYKDNLFYLRNNFNRNVPVFTINEIEQPLLPNSCELSEYEEIYERTNRAKGFISYDVDKVKQERANIAHTKLINLVSERIRDHGGIPKSNQLIDLAVKFDHNFLFEMKSTNDENVRNQVRKGLSQLYEYRYLQNKPDAKLILAIENPLDEKKQWMIDYIENDRGIFLIWDGENNLFGTEKSKSELKFLDLN